MIRALLLAITLIFAAIPASAGNTVTDELYQKLKDAPTPEEAAQVAQDIWAGWMESGSPTVDLLMERALAAQAIGDTAHARALYDRVIQLEPEFAEAWNRRATLFLAEENYPEALRDVNETLTLEPRHFGAWTGLGFVFEGLGATKEAVTAYNKALEIYPQQPQAKAAIARLTQTSQGTAL